MYRHVKGTGSYDARILLVGEAPGREEDQLGYPFAGQSGYKLNSWWFENGLTREMFRIENVYEYLPNEQNDITKVPLEVLEEWSRYLHERITSAKMVVVVPRGTLPRTATKGNVRRCAVEDMFRAELDTMFASA